MLMAARGRGNGTSLDAMPATISFAESELHGFMGSRCHARGGVGVAKTTVGGVQTIHGFLRYGIDSNTTKQSDTTVANWPDGLLGVGAGDIENPTNKNYHCFQTKTVTQSVALTDDKGTGITLANFPSFNGLDQINQYTVNSKYTGGVTGSEIQDGDSLSDRMNSGDIISDSVSHAGGSSRTKVYQKDLSVYDIGGGNYSLSNPGSGYVDDLTFQWTVVTEWSDDYVWADYIEDFRTNLFAALPSDKWTTQYTLDSTGTIAAGNVVNHMNRIAVIPTLSNLHVFGAGYTWATDAGGSTYYPSIPCAEFRTITILGPPVARYSCETDGTTSVSNSASELLDWSHEMTFQYGPSSADIDGLLDSEVQKQYSIYWADAYDDVTPNYPAPS